MIGLYIMIIIYLSIFFVGVLFATSLLDTLVCQVTLPFLHMLGMAVIIKGCDDHHDLDDDRDDDDDV